MSKTWKLAIPATLIVAVLLVWQFGLGPRKAAPGTAAGEAGANSAVAAFTKTFDPGYEASGKTGCDVLTDASAERVARAGGTSCADALERVQHSAPIKDLSWLVGQGCRYREMTAERAVCDFDVRTPVPASLSSLLPRPQLTLVRTDGRWRVELPTS